MTQEVRLVEISERVVRQEEEPRTIKKTESNDRLTI